MIFIVLLIVSGVIVMPFTSTKWWPLIYIGIFAVVLALYIWLFDRTLLYPLRAEKTGEGWFENWFSESGAGPGWGDDWTDNGDNGGVGT